MELKNVYIGSSISELNKKGIYEFHANRSIKIHISHSDKTFQAAEKARISGDEERGYILYMRYMDIFQKVRNSRNYKKDEGHYSLLLGSSKFMDAIKHAENLSASLKKRYGEKIGVINSAKEDLEGKNVGSPKLIKSTSTNGVTPGPNTSAPKNISHPIPKESRIISCDHLYELLFNNHVPEYSILMIDIRTSEDFHLSCIRHPNCINISKNILLPGIVCKKIDPQIDNADHFEQWSCRATADCIVLIDWNGSVKRLEDVKDPLKCLCDALIKWEQDIFLKHDPVVLIGGYTDWLDFYPQFTTNSKVERPVVKPKNTTSITSLTDFDYGHLIPQITNSTVYNNTVEESGNDKEDWDTAEMLGGVGASQSLNSKSANANESHSEETVGSPSPNTDVTCDVILDTNKKESLMKDYKDGPRSLNISNGAVSVRKSIPAINRSTKPTIPSRNLKPHPTQIKYDYINEKPVSTNLENWPPFSQINTPEKPPSSNMDSQYAETMNRIEATRKRKDQEERKLNDLMEKSRLADAQTLEKQVQEETEDIERKRKIQEKELANKMRGLIKVNKPKEETKPISQRDEVSGNFALTMIEKQESEKSYKSGLHSNDKTIKNSQPIVSRDKKPVIPEVKEIVQTQSEKPDLPRMDVTKSLENKPEEPASLPQKQIINSETIVATQDPRQEITEEDTFEPNDAFVKKSLIKTDDTKQNVKPKPAMKKIVSRELPQPQPKASINGIERKGTTNLPINWEKRLDAQTGRYFYLDHKTKTTHWELPNVVRAQISKVPLKDDKTSSSGSLKRSSSTPNIAQLVENENDVAIVPKPIVPNRGNKPSSSPEVDSPDVYAQKLARLHPEAGGTGPGLCGLRNLGNTCYMNSVLQCMFNTTFLAKYFLTNSYKQFINRENFLGSSGLITEGFALLMKASWEGRYKHLTPRDFRSTISNFNPRFATYTQQDSQELLLFLMDGLHEDLNEIKKRTYIEEEDNDGISDRKAAEISWKNHTRLNKSVIVELFQGQFKATMQCLHCRKTSRKFDVFMYLSLPMPSNNNCSINDCVEKFSENEKLTGDNKWRCPACKTERDAIRKMEIWKLPPVLLIHFKRFSFCGRWGDKVQTSVSFPEKGLNLNPFVRGPEKKKTYELYSVSHHHGASLDSGHYVASCKSPIDNKWYKYDDHEVSGTSVPKGPSAYILCYTSMAHSLVLVR